jgi:hypothetical protein
MMKRFMTYVFAAALLVGTAGATNVAAQTDQWNGLMLNATGIGPTAGNFQIDVTEYSSQEEVNEYIRILRDDGPRRLEGALNGNRHGSIRMNGLGTPIGMARELPGEDGGRIIRLVTAREIGLERNGRLSRSGDFAFGIIELRLDAEGNGTGFVLPATELRFDSDGQLVIQTMGVPQVELTEVNKR